MSRRLRRTFLTVLCSAVFLGAGSASASAATQWVALTGSVGANTSCSSPGFVGEAQFGAAVAAASPGDTLHMCAGTWSSVVVGGFDIDKSLTVVGDGQGVTVLDGSGSTLPVLESGAGTLAVRDLTVRNGNAEAPGAIGTVGSLLMEDVTIANSGGFTSSVGMFDPAGTLTIRGSTLTGQAAGASYPAPLVVSSGTTTIEDSTFADNSVDYNGFAGIVTFVPGVDFVISGSTFSNLDGACGAAIANYFDTSPPLGGEVRVTNSTFTGNQPDNSKCYSGVITGQHLILNNATVANNDAPATTNVLFAFSSLEIGNSIISEDSPSSTTCARDASGVMTNNGGNVISDTTVGCDDFVGGASPSLQTKVLESAIDLGPLADNGGPTETMALGAASVARGAAIKAECPEDDQRGVTRGAPCTSGAWQERTSGKPTVKQKGRAGKDSLTVRVRCADSGPCRIRLSGVLKGGKGKLKSKTVKVRAGGKTVELPYTSLLERELRSKGGSGSVRVRAKEIGGGSASTLVWVTLPDPVTG